MTQQVGQANVNGTKLKSLVVPLPSTVVQLQIRDEVERLTAAGSSLGPTLHKAVADARLLNRSLLNAVVAGELAPRRDGDGTGTELLVKAKAWKANQPGRGRKTRRAVLVGE